MKISSISDIDRAFSCFTNEGDKWHEDSIPGPTPTCIREASRVFNQLWDEYRVLPKYLKQTVEGGIFADFNGGLDGKQVVLEIYNDGTGAILINNSVTKKVEETIDLPIEDKERIVCQIIVKIYGSY